MKPFTQEELLNIVNRRRSRASLVTWRWIYFFAVLGAIDLVFLIWKLLHS